MEKVKIPLETIIEFTKNLKILTEAFESAAKSLNEFTKVWNETVKEAIREDSEKIKRTDTP